MTVTQRPCAYKKAMDRKGKFIRVKKFTPLTSSQKKSRGNSCLIKDLIKRHGNGQQRLVNVSINTMFSQEGECGMVITKVSLEIETLERLICYNEII